MDIAGKANYELLKWGVSKLMFCPYTDKILDVRTAVMTQVTLHVSDEDRANGVTGTITRGHTMVSDGEWFDGRRAEFLANLQDDVNQGIFGAVDIEIYDGRTMPKGRNELQVEEIHIGKVDA